MFSSKQYLEKKTGPYGIGRLSYLQSLVNEFQESTNTEAKEQVLANLANFAYDPINYDYLRQLNVIDLFLDCLSEDSDVFKEYAVSGLCNLCLDKENKSLILKRNGAHLVTSCLSSKHEETVLSAMTTLMYLITPSSRKDIVTHPLIVALVRFSKSSNRRIANLATVFCQDYCSEADISRAEAEIQSRQQTTLAPSDVD